MPLSRRALNVAVSVTALSANHAFQAPLNRQSTRHLPGTNSATTGPSSLNHITPATARLTQRHNVLSHQHNLRQARHLTPGHFGQSHPLTSSTACQGSLWPDSDYPELAFKGPLNLRFEPLGQHAFPIFELSANSQNLEFPDTELPNTAAVDLAQFLAPGTVYIAFSDTEAHLGQVTEQVTEQITEQSTPEAQLQKLDAPNCPFTKAKVVTSDGVDYSGLYLVPTDLPPSLRKHLYQAVESVLAQPHRGRINTLTDILTQAGCDLNTVPDNTTATPPTLKDCRTQTDLLQALMHYGLRYNDTPIPARFINTTPMSLQQLKDKMDYSHLAEPMKHLRAHLEPAEIKAQRQSAAADIREKNTPVDLPENTTPPPSAYNNSIAISAAKTSPTGALLRKHISPHVLFNVALNSHEVAQQLPERLKAFDQKNPDLITRLKKDVLFPPHMATKVHNLMAESFDTPHHISGSELLSLLAHQGQQQHQQSAQSRTHLANNPAEGAQRFNCVITDNNLVLGQVKAGCEAVDDVLSKHVLLAEYGDVRFAGEVYVTGKTLYLTRNSGTYRPSETQLNDAAALLSKQFPTLRVKADHTPPH